MMKLGVTGKFVRRKVTLSRCVRLILGIRGVLKNLKSVKMDMKPVLSLADVPSRVAVHGTTRQAWSSIGKCIIAKRLSQCAC